jgi:hypothetical protein
LAPDKWYDRQSRLLSEPRQSKWLNPCHSYTDGRPGCGSSSVPRCGRRLFVWVRASEVQRVQTGSRFCHCSAASVPFWGQGQLVVPADGLTVFVSRLERLIAGFVSSRHLPVAALRVHDLSCRGVLGQWALLKWGSTESRDQHDRMTPAFHPGVQRRVVP